MFGGIILPQSGFQCSIFWSEIWLGGGKDWCITPASTPSTKGLIQPLDITVEWTMIVKTSPGIQILSCGKPIWTFTFVLGNNCVITYSIVGHFLVWYCIWKYSVKMQSFCWDLYCPKKIVKSVWRISNETRLNNLPSPVVLCQSPLIADPELPRRVFVSLW